MALRDRITVKTVDGTTTIIAATRSGGDVVLTQKPRENTILVEEVSGKKTLRVLNVAINQVVWVLEERDVPAEAKPKRKPRAAAVE